MTILSPFGFVEREATSGGHKCRWFGDGGLWAFVFPFSDTKDTTSPENVSPESSEITQEQLLDKPPLPHPLKVPTSLWLLPDQGFVLTPLADSRDGEWHGGEARGLSNLGSSGSQP